MKQSFNNYGLANDSVGYSTKTEKDSVGKTRQWNHTVRCLFRHQSLICLFFKKNEDARGHKSSKYRKRKKDAVICCRISRIGNFSYESQLNSPVDATVKVKHAALKISQTDLIGTNQGNYERIFSLSLSANCDTFVGSELKCGNWSRINLILDRVTSQHYTMVMHDKTMNSILH